eukprot:Skav210713  [mRNA]  locus=scaffold1582:338446:339138:+ [translate_table: standard]
MVIPPLEEPVEGEEKGEDPHGLDEEEVQPGPSELYDHVSKDHHPYFSSCLSCVRARGRTPARRLRYTRGTSSIGADFTSLGTLNLLVVMVFATGFIPGVVCGDNNETTARKLNGILKEGGLTGRQLDFYSDGEPALHALFRTASRLDGCPFTGITFQTSAAAGSQSNGKIERANQTLKSLVATNLVLLETRLGKRVALESPIVPFGVDYSLGHTTFTMFLKDHSVLPLTD